METAKVKEMKVQGMQASLPFKQMAVLLCPFLAHQEKWEMAGESRKATGTKNNKLQ